ncbi:3163_t:CDS:2 [Cetraspora pellucida]|uniref:3163_t:CDS:1 n=1 Tax=Cetraspora pellucida TaxID=1433469 RepID=A0ACA9KJ63_9GLOM|nr:3163_t:CDS:2 [Cetraspora pellucida]
MSLKVYIIFAIIILALALSTSSAPADGVGGFIHMKSPNGKALKIKRDANPSPDGAFYNMADLKKEKRDFTQSLSEREAEVQHLSKRAVIKEGGSYNVINDILYHIKNIKLYFCASFQK